MFPNKPDAKSKRRGAIAILIAVCLTVLLGGVAIALDGGLLQDNKRRVQSAADAAAIAGANKIFFNYPIITSLNVADPNSVVSTAAQNSASDNGFANGGATSVTVNTPPASGPFKNKLGYVEVIIIYSQPRYFASIWGASATQIYARAVAKGYWGGTGDGVIVLDMSAKDSLDASGTGSVTVTGGANMIVDSNNYEAGRQTGGGGLTAAAFDVTGGTTGTFNGPVTTGTPPIPDPLAYLPAPTVPPNGSMSTQSLGKGNKQYTLTPGRYTNLPSLQVGDILVLKQASAGNNGIFYLDGGGLNSSGGTIIMDPTTSGGVMVYNAPASGAANQGISISGNALGTVNLSPLTSGPYAGILFWQARTATQTMAIAGQGSFNLTGTFYAANSNLQITGNGDATIGSQYISRTLNLSGNGNILINYTDNGTARKREVRLVE